jgi:hypothetical protein
VWDVLLKELEGRVGHVFLAEQRNQHDRTGRRNAFGLPSPLILAASTPWTAALLL